MIGPIFPGDDPDRTLAKLAALTRDIERLHAGIVPTAADLDQAPVLHNWIPAIRGVGCLAGEVRAHPLLGDRRMVSTSEVYAVDHVRGWARTYSRFYLLGRKSEARQVRHG